jgi:hypothetical protein
LAWYQRTYFNLKKGFQNINFKIIVHVVTISAVICFVITYHQPTQCLKYISSYNIGGNIIRLYNYYPPQIKHIVPNHIDIIEIIKNAQLSFQSDKLKYNIIKYKPLNELIKIDKFSPAAHPQIIMTNLIHPDFFLTYQFSSNLTPNMRNHFSEISGECILESDKPQFLSNNPYLFEKTLFDTYMYEVEKSSKYLETNQKKIIAHINKSLSSYKLDIKN